MPEGSNKKYFIEFGEKLRLARESLGEGFVSKENRNETLSVQSISSEDKVKSGRGFYKVLFLSLIAVLVLYWPNRERDNEQIRQLINYLGQKFFIQGTINE